MLLYLEEVCLSCGIFTHPAEMFMGDTGSLAIGGLVGVIALMVHQPITLIIVGGIFVIEAASVILQVASFKSTETNFLMSRSTPSL